jgi:glycosyltransferase involved in cell wall biosynthesis
MNILMMTNTYTPYVGGVASSVSAFTGELRKQNHRVVVVAPEYGDGVKDEQDVVRIPAIQHFTGSDFSVILPIPVLLENHIDNFKPEIVHSHHPFLIGSTATRLAKKYNVPLVYTQHTMYEEYTHYVPIGFAKLKQFVISLSTGYANLSEQVIAPSQSIAKIIRERGVKTPIEIVPTGVHTDRFAQGNGEDFRKSHNMPRDVFVVGHVGRLAPEKNLNFLSQAVASFLRNESRAHFMVVGYGPSEKKLKEFFAENNLQKRVHLIGKLQGQKLIDAYHAMDVFAFSSKSETQGLVLAEAMAAGIPVVALDASGVREVLRDGVNGCMLTEQDEQHFSDALSRFCKMSPETRQKFVEEAQKTARDFSVDTCVSKLVSVYQRLKKDSVSEYRRDESVWKKSIEQIKAEWELLSNLTTAVGDAIQKDSNEK